MPKSMLLQQIVSECATHSLLQSVPYRPADFQKPKQGKSLNKLFSQFKTHSRRADQIGTNGGQGEYLKTKSSGGSSHYYLANRGWTREYFIFEIMNLLGLHVPKARIVPNQSDVLIASKAIPAFIPMEAVLGRIPTKSNDEYMQSLDKLFLERRKALLSSSRKTPLQTVAARYDLDEATQMIKDTETGESYPIRGQLFASKWIADFLQDLDAGIDANNAGVAQQAGAFNFYLIDKQNAHWEEPSKNSLDFPYDKSQLARSATREQNLAFLYQMANLFVEKDGQSLLEKIYLNPRTKEMIFPIMQQNAAGGCVSAVIRAITEKHLTISNWDTALQPFYFKLLELCKATKIPLVERPSKQDCLDFAKQLDELIQRELDVLLKSLGVNDKTKQIIMSDVSKSHWQWNWVAELQNMETHVSNLFAKQNVTVEEMQEYIQREKIREQIADLVLAKVQLPEGVSAQLVKKNICEDLRSIRYPLTSKNDLANTQLIDDLALATQQELNHAESPLLTHAFK